MAILKGTSGSDSLIGTASADTLSGFDGNDILSGAAGNDTLDGGLGDDVMLGGLGNDTYVVDSINDVINENSGEGTDTVKATVSYVMHANIENLILTGTSAIDGTGNAGDNIITGNTAANILSGGAGNDTLNGGVGADAMIGGTGNDTYTVDNVGDVVTESAGEGIDTVQSSVSYMLGANVENLTLTGTAAINGTGNADANVLTGNSGANILTGGAGNDTLNGGGGTDTLIGGTGDDIYVVDRITDVVTEAAGEGTDTVQSSVSYTLGANVENLTLTGTSAINGTGNADANVLTGNTGNNILDGAAGADTMVGGRGNDTYVVDNAGDVITEAANEGTDMVKASVSYTLGANVETLTLTGTAALNGTGNTLNNTLTGNSGDNILDGGVGADKMIGGSGNDTYVVDNAKDVVTEVASAGTDTVQSSITYTIGVNVENLTLTGSAAINATGNTLNNTLTGNAGNNVLSGGAGADTMLGGAGDDTYVVENVGDVVTESASEGTDTVQSSVSFTLGTNVENLTLTGTGAVNGTGNAADNVLIGNAMANALTGGAGNDTLNGGGGADTLVGGTGDDIYVVDNIADLVTEVAGEGTDTVQSSVTYTLGANVENLTLTGTGAVNGTGNALNNTLTGNSGNNILDGGVGADAMIGGSGNDTYVVDNVGDVVTENVAGGTDTVQASVTYTLGANIENLTLTGTASINGTGNTLNNTLTGNSGNNILDGGVGTDAMIGGTGDDTYVVDNIGDVVTEAASAGTDTVQSSITYVLGSNVENLTLTGTSAINATGNTLNNVLTGNTGNNILSGGTGADTMIGGAGNDTYVVDNVGDVVTENASEGTDLVQSSVTYALSAHVENLTLTGALSINGTGNADANTLTGNSGANILDGGLGADTMIGGAGNDIYVVDNVGDVVTEAASAGTDTVQSSISFSILALANVENITLTGSSAIDATGNAVVNVLTGNAGNNVLDGGLGADTMVGGLGNDIYVVDNVGDVVTELADEGTDLVRSNISYTLGVNLENLLLTGTGVINGTGNALGNVITGNSANNILDGGLGADTMVGGLGNDTYLVDNVGDVVTENVGEGTDTVQSSVTFTLSVNVDNLTLTGVTAIDGTGNADANILTGNSGNNILDGGAGADTMSGGAGNDTYVVDNVGDVITEAVSAGTDMVRSSVTYTLGTNIENLTLTGVAAVDGYGNTVTNFLVGNSANNTLDGGAGADVMSGGLGNDIYVIDNVGDVVIESAGEGTDLVRTSVAYTLGANIENLTLTGAAAINGTGNDGNNILTGNAASNTLDGGAGADTMIGGMGDDIYVIDNAGDVVTENAAEGLDLVRSSITYTLVANVENLALTGAAAINGTGNTLNNTLTGNAADNILDGGAGADTMIGGAGNDTYVVDNMGDVVTESAGEGTDLVQASVTYELEANVENLTLTGAAAINAMGNALDNVLTGNSGVNILDGGAGADTMIGGAGNDTYVVDNIGDVATEGAGGGTDLVQAGVTYTLGAEVENLTLTGATAINGTGNALNNTITGNAVDNILDGGVGADTMVGGLGDDTYIVDNAGDVVTEGAAAGADVVLSSITYTLGANVEELVLTGVSAINGTGNTLNNTLTGNVSDNILNGGTGIDTMIGGLGNDTYTVDNMGDVVTEAAGEGTDLVNASVTYILSANIENLTLTGAGVIDGSGNDLNNTITGNAANNILDGGAGIDTLIGGAGNDTYIVDDAAEVITEGAAAGTDLVLSSISFSLAAFVNVENLTLTGGSDINATGNTAVNVLTGNTGNNTLDGGAGADTMVGGLGDDTYIVDNATDVVTEGASAGTDTIRSSVTYTLGANVENLILIGATAINATGNTLNNVITGNSAANTINGGAGADTMAGGGGNDTYAVDHVSDVIIELEGAGTDAVNSSVSYTLSDNIENLTLTGAGIIDGTGNALNNTITGNTANNILDGGLGADTMVGGTGNDTYFVDNVGDVVTEAASAGTDTVRSSITYSVAALANVENITLIGTGAINATGNAAVNILTGNAANNTLDGGAGADTMIGGEGDDTYVVDNAGDVVTEGAGAGTDTVQSSITYSIAALANLENVTLTGVGVINATGNALNNILTGNSANNTLDGGVGADTMIGGVGNDTYVVDSAGDVVTENAGEGTDLVQSSITYALGSDVENLTLTGAAAINATGNILNNTLTGNTADNILDGGFGADTMVGGTGNDTYFVDNIGDIVTEGAAAGTDTVKSTITYSIAALANLENITLLGASAINATGNAAVNILTGNTANNTLDGGAGADTMVGGAGNDTYVVDNVADVVTENVGEGTDLVNASVTYTLGADVENLTLTGAAAINGTGNTLDNILTGNTANNTLDGGVGADTMAGGAGNDTYVIDNVADVITEGAAAGTDSVQSSVSHTLSVNVENLTLTGAGVIDGSGNALANVIVGNAARNTLYGAGGTDTLTGGGGDDTFLFDASTAYSGVVTVTDFNTAAGDVLDISDLLTDYDPLTDLLTDFVRITDAGSNSTVEVDRDGTGTGFGFTQIATLTGVTGLTDEGALVAANNLVVG
jgi:Ca2+-binding RTX toxin-like protein